MPRFTFHWYLETLSARACEQPQLAGCKECNTTPCPSHRLSEACLEMNTWITAFSLDWDQPKDDVHQHSVDCRPRPVKVEEEECILRNGVAWLTFTQGPRAVLQIDIQLTVAQQIRVCPGRQGPHTMCVVWLGVEAGCCHAPQELRRLERTQEPLQESWTFSLYVSGCKYRVDRLNWIDVFSFPFPPLVLTIVSFPMRTLKVHWRKQIF